MKVMKFGGTSVGSAERMRGVSRLVSNAEPKIVVLSAMSGVTNLLLTLSAALHKGHTDEALEALTQLRDKHLAVADELLDGEWRAQGRDKVESLAASLEKIIHSPIDAWTEKRIVAHGELFSTNLFHTYLLQQGHASALLPALDFMRKDEQGEPDLDEISRLLGKQLEEHPDCHLFVTQGFICRDAEGRVDNLERGGSDYTASIVGAAVDADEIQIWTDIDGMHNNDPRVVDGTQPVRHLHFEEAAELAYFGAKILHPTCIQPAKEKGIPVRLLNTMDPEAPGTVITNELERGSIKAVAAKDGITAIKIKSSRMLLAHGFLRKVFEIFETYRTPIDMVCTSEVGVSMSVDHPEHLDEIVRDLSAYGAVTVDSNMCIVCVVGDMEWENVGFEAWALHALRDIPVRMISFGGSNYNISILVRESDKAAALKALSAALFPTA